MTTSPNATGTKHGNLALVFVALVLAMLLASLN
jgi:hypothetical protein